MISVVTEENAVGRTSPHIDWMLYAAASATPLLTLPQAYSIGLSSGW